MCPCHVCMCACVCAWAATRAGCVKYSVLIQFSQPEQNLSFYYRTEEWNDDEEANEIEEEEEACSALSAYPHICCIYYLCSYVCYLVRWSKIIITIATDDVAVAVATAGRRHNRRTLYVRSIIWATYFSYTRGGCCGCDFVLLLITKTYTNCITLIQNVYRKYTISVYTMLTYSYIWPLIEICLASWMVLPWQILLIKNLLGIDYIKAMAVIIMHIIRSTNFYFIFKLFAIFFT